MPRPNYMKIPKDGRVTCPKDDKPTDVDYCRAHCLDYASNHARKVENAKSVCLASASLIVPKSWGCFESQKNAEATK